MAPQCSPDAIGFWSEDVEHAGDPAIKYTCGVLCALDDACNACGKVVCYSEPFHMQGCDECLLAFCDGCMRGAFVGGEFIGGNVCEGCVVAQEEELWMQRLEGAYGDDEYPTS